MNKKQLSISMISIFYPVNSIFEEINIKEIIKIRPAQKAIIVSGYAKTKEVEIAQELGAGKYIKKPYILAKIGIAVKEELEK